MKSVRKSHLPDPDRKSTFRRAKTVPETGRRLGRAVMWGACVSGVIVLAAVTLWPLRNAGPDLSRSPASDQPLPTPSIVELPSRPVEATSEELRNELLALAEALLARFPKVPAAMHVVALLYVDLQKTAEAEAIWRECIPLAPHQAGPYVGLATAVMELGRDTEAVEILKQARDAGCSTPEIHSQLAAALTKLGMLEEAVQMAQDGLGRFPQVSENWLQLGQIQNQLGKFAEAEASLKQAIASGSTSETVYFALATSCARQGKQEEASKHRQEFSDRKAARASGSDDRFQSRYDSEMRRMAVASIARAGTVYDQQGDPAQAETLLVRALKLAPENLVVHNELAMFYRRSGRIADARVVQRRLVELDPQHIPHQVNLASLSQQLGDYEAAERELNEIVRSHPDLAIGYFSLAQIYLRGGKVKQARAYAETALQRQFRGPEDTVTAYLVLAAACQQMGDSTAARDAFAKAEQLSSNPTGKQLRTQPP